MSIAPPTEEETIGFGPAQETRMAVSKVSRGFSKDPLYFILLASVSCTIVGLLIGLRFTPMLYVVLSVLVLAVLGKFFYKENKKDEE